MIGYIAIGFCAAAALFIVLAPLRRAPRTESPETSIDIDEAESRKRAALIAIVDLENERDVGKLAEEEFRTLRTEYEAEAVEAFHQLDRLGAASGAEEDALEAEIARIRAQLRS
jgi:hypothetical protein